MEELRATLGSVAELLSNGILSAEEAAEIKAGALEDFRTARAAAREQAHTQKEAALRDAQLAGQIHAMAERETQLAGEVLQYAPLLTYRPAS